MTSPSGEVLAACPFCGSEHVQPACKNVLGETFHFGFCEACESRGPESRDRDRAIAAWNTRPSPPPPADDKAGGVSAERIAEIIADYAGGATYAGKCEPDEMVGMTSANVACRLFADVVSALRELQRLRAAPMVSPLPEGFTDIDDYIREKCNNPEYAALHLAARAKLHAEFGPVPVEPGKVCALNQCGGCRAGMPLNEHGNHEFNGRPEMGCTAHLYAPPQPRAVTEGERANAQRYRVLRNSVLQAPMSAGMTLLTTEADIDAQCDQILRQQEGGAV